ncbi:MAG: phage holin family protein [Peptostreptococcaceae bacterium]|nr:phage holin family protein [Peptostreptococcaceae bacterium]
MDFFMDLQGDIFIKALLIVCVWDLVLGMLRAVNERTFNSSMGINGAIRKSGMLISAFFLKLLDYTLKFNLINFIPKEFLSYMPFDSVGACEIFCICFVACEFLSSLKNLSRSNIPIPYKLKEFIEYMLDTFTTENNKKDKVGV